MRRVLAPRFTVKIKINSPTTGMGVGGASSTKAQENSALLSVGPRILSPENNLSTTHPSNSYHHPALPLHFPEEKITITSTTSLISVYRAPKRVRYVMANTVILHSSREHRERQKESRCAPLFPATRSIPDSFHSPIPHPRSARRRCIFRREARGNSGTLTPEAGFWTWGWRW